MMNSKLSRYFLLSCLAFFAVSLQAQTVKFNNDGTFKVVQFTDVHYCYGVEHSKRSEECIVNVIEAEKPDLVVFSGDIVVGAPADKGWEVITGLVASRGIPYAVTIGNHDDECGLTREQVANLLEKSKGSLLKAKVKGVTGYGNYVVPVMSKDGKKTEALVYCMDSRSYSTIDNIDGYGWFAPDQIDWYRKQSATFKAANGGTPVPALAFFHIPLPEHREAFNDKLVMPSGQRNENECSPELNSGMFTAMVEGGDVMGISVGHDHVNDYLAYKNGIALSYGHFTGSENTYTFADKMNGGRVFVLKEGKHSFETWIRLSNGKVKDFMTQPRSAAFVVAADLHFDNDPETDQFCHVKAINSLVPKGLEKRVDVVAIAGDIFNDPGVKAVNLFRERYEKGEGEKRIHYPVMPGYGNHDIDPATYDIMENMRTRRISLAYMDSLLTKKLAKGDILRLHPESRNYSWNVGDVHFIQAQRFFGDSVDGVCSAEWENWVKYDLEKYAEKGEPVIIIQHYTFTDKGVNRWWLEESRKKMAEILAPYNVIAIFVGHNHHKSMQNLGDIPVFMVNNAWKDQSGPASFAYGIVDGDKLRVSTYAWEVDGDDVAKVGDDIVLDIKRKKINK